jgi:hypothetical protein
MATKKQHDGLEQTEFTIPWTLVMNRNLRALPLTLGMVRYEFMEVSAHHREEGKDEKDEEEETKIEFMPFSARQNENYEASLSSTFSCCYWKEHSQRPNSSTSAESASSKCQPHHNKCEVKYATLDMMNSIVACPADYNVYNLIPLIQSLSTLDVDSYYHDEVFLLLRPSEEVRKAGTSDLFRFAEFLTEESRERNHVKLDVVDFNDKLSKPFVRIISEDFS